MAGQTATLPNHFQSGPFMQLGIALALEMSSNTLSRLYEIFVQKTIDTKIFREHFDNPLILLL
jgi:hypothetical protein